MPCVYISCHMSIMYLRHIPKVDAPCHLSSLHIICLHFKPYVYIPYHTFILHIICLRLRPCVHHMACGYARGESRSRTRHIHSAYDYATRHRYVYLALCGGTQIPDLLCSPDCFKNIQEFDFSYNQVCPETISCNSCNLPNSHRLFRSKATHMEDCVQSNLNISKHDKSMALLWDRIANHLSYVVR